MKEVLKEIFADIIFDPWIRWMLGLTGFAIISILVASRLLANP